jgi:hypothetical protein
MKELEPVTPQTDLVQQFLGILNLFLGPQISLQEMTGARLSPTDE